MDNKGKMWYKEQATFPLRKGNAMAKSKNDIDAPEGQKVLSDRKGGNVIVDEDTSTSQLHLTPKAIPGNTETKLENNDENVLKNLVSKQKTKDDTEQPKEPKATAFSKGGDPQSVSPSNSGIEGKPTKKELKQHPTADVEVTFAADAPNSSHISDPLLAAEFAKKARVEGHADGQRQRCSTWWHPSAVIEDANLEVGEDGKLEHPSASKVETVDEYNHW